jgi:hypothetical protein
VDLVLWWMDGVLAVYRGRGGGLPDVSVGRTGSKLGLGFRVTSEKGRQKHVEFVLDRVQVKWLHAFLAYSMPRLNTKPRGKAAARKELARLREHRRQAYPGESSKSSDS